MRQDIAICGLMALFALAGHPAAADCYADYKAKRDDPLQLHYGVIELADGVCGKPQAVKQEIASRIAADGWKLLSVVSTFGAAGLGDEQRRANAGSFFLRY
ncbi:MAG: hypothetical protein CSA74_05000 [Rhodobacterales bacterium]|nr:MAG: hypothetical protein CSA74_05000 [Rhodobacterales bacterium]